MPFGLKSIVLTLKNINNNLFVGKFEHSVSAYLDDLIPASKDPKSHLDTLKSVFQKMKQAGLGQK